MNSSQPTSHRNAHVQTMREFAAAATSAAEKALAPARTTLPESSSARNAAVRLGNAIQAAAKLSTDLIEQRDTIERDNHLRADLRQRRWTEAKANFERQAADLRRRIAHDAQSFPTALAAEAVPRVDDASATLVGRQEVELAIRSTPPGQAHETLARFAHTAGRPARWRPPTTAGCC